MNQTETISALQQGRFDAVLQQLYACSPAEVVPYRERLIGAVEAFGQEFGTDGEISLFSAPGRTELCGLGATRARADMSSRVRWIWTLLPWQPDATTARSG